MYKWILNKKGILNKREYLGPVWPADVWPANNDIPFCSIFTYFQYSLIHELALYLTMDLYMIWVLEYVLLIWLHFSTVQKSKINVINFFFTIPFWGLSNFFLQILAYLLSLWQKNNELISKRQVLCTLCKCTFVWSSDRNDFLKRKYFKEI